MYFDVSSRGISNEPKSIVLCTISPGDKSVVITHADGTPVRDSFNICLNIEDPGDSNSLRYHDWNNKFVLSRVFAPWRIFSNRNKLFKFLSVSWNVFLRVFKRKSILMYKRLECDEEEEDCVMWNDFKECILYSCCSLSVTQIFYSFVSIKNSINNIEGYDDFINKEYDVEDMGKLWEIIMDSSEFCFSPCAMERIMTDELCEWVIQYLHLDNVNTYNTLGLRMSYLPWFEKKGNKNICDVRRWIK